MNYTLFAILITLILSAFFSGMEIAFVSSNKLRVELDKKQKRFPSGILDVFFKKPAFYITTMLVGNNIALVLYGIYMTRLLDPLYQTSSEFINFLLHTVTATLIILVLAEFLPKALFRLKPNNFLNIFAIPVLLIYLIIYPITWSITFISSLLLKKFFKFENRTSGSYHER